MDFPPSARLGWTDGGRKLLGLNPGVGDQRKWLFEIFHLRVSDRIAVSEPDTGLAVDEALAGLEADDPGAAAVARLRLFAGLTVEEAGDALGVSRATVFRDWRSPAPG